MVDPISGAETMPCEWEIKEGGPAQRPARCPEWTKSGPCVWPKCDCGELPASRTPAESADEASDLVKLAAECHRAKWAFQVDEEAPPRAHEARQLVIKAFDELHRIGDMARKMYDEARCCTQPEIDDDVLEGTRAALRKALNKVATLEVEKADLVNKVLIYAHRAEVASQSQPERCAKCGAALNGEAALVDGQEWCHPCADGNSQPVMDDMQGRIHNLELRCSAMLERAERAETQVERWHECAQYDPLMEGPRFKGWDRSALDRCRKEFIEGKLPLTSTERQ